MIVISGALVLVALVLLVLGLTMTDLNFVYGSIGVSLVSFVFLLIGILQRRGEPAPAGGPQVTEGDGEPESDSARGEQTSGAAAPAATTALATPAAATSGSVRVSDDVAAASDDDAEYDDELEPGGGPVLVVAGRPRYHVEGCRYLNGRQAQELDVLDAREDGFNPCGVCKPDEVLEELYGPLDELPADDDEVAVDDLPAAEPLQAPDEVVDTGVPGAGDGEPAPRGRKRAGSAAVGTLDPDTSAPRPAKKAAAQPASGRRTTAAQTPARAAASPQAVVEAPLAGTGAASRTKVVVIPDRDRFHTPSCRFVRSSLGTQELTRAQAGKQGYRACGVCKP